MQQVGCSGFHFYPLVSLQEKMTPGEWENQDSSHNILRKTKIIPTWKSMRQGRGHALAVLQVSDKKSQYSD